ncbi:MAG: hypothetical protein N2Z80_03220 [Hydrogenothermaceae bacterium]|nr:hypothetical protein [Hydrogenothermaceae bacterium]
MSVSFVVKNFTLTWKKKIVLDFFRIYFSKLRQTDEKEKRQGFVQAEDKKLTSEEFMRKYGSILKL